jgi:cytochrome c
MKTSAVVTVLVAGLAAGAIRPAAAADPVRGQQIFERCQACHALDAAGSQEKGPTLHGVFGRKAATAPGYTQYSEAFKKLAVVWDEKSLDAFLADPKTFAPDNTMAFSALRKEPDRADLIAFLLQATK